MKPPSPPKTGTSDQATDLHPATHSFNRCSSTYPLPDTRLGAGDMVVNTYNAGPHTADALENSKNVRESGVDVKPLRAAQKVPPLYGSLPSPPALLSTPPPTATGMGLSL